VLTGQGRRLFTWAHLLGILSGATVLAAWIVPYYGVMGVSGVRAAWLGDPALRIQDWELRAVAEHLLTYPLEVAAGTLPWSLLLLPYLYRGFRQVLGTARPHVRFLGLCLAIAFPTCWIHPGGQPRFFAPLYPCLAVLIGVAVERCAGAAAAPLRTAWRRYLVLAAAVMGLVAIAVPIAAMGVARRPALAHWAEPPLLALVYTMAAAGLTLLTWRLRHGGPERCVRWGVLAVAGFMVLLFSGLLTDVRVRRSEDTAAAMRRLKEHLPPGQVLVSLDGHIDCLFSYHYGRPFIVSGPRAWEDPGAAVSYFCIESPGDRRPRLAFAWEEVGVVSLERNRQEVPERVAVVGRRATR
jgi:hypothetical protein